MSDNYVNKFLEWKCLHTVILSWQPGPRPGWGKVHWFTADCWYDLWRIIFYADSYRHCWSLCILTCHLSLTLMKWSWFNSWENGEWPGSVLKHAEGWWDPVNIYLLAGNHFIYSCPNYCNFSHCFKGNWLFSAWFFSVCCWEMQQVKFVLVHFEEDDHNKV